MILAIESARWQHDSAGAVFAKDCENGHRKVMIGTDLDWSIPVLTGVLTRYGISNDEEATGRFGDVYPCGNFCRAGG